MLARADSARSAVAIGNIINVVAFYSFWTLGGRLVTALKEARQRKSGASLSDMW